MADRLNWGILGTGAIAKKFARGVMESKTGQLVAVGSRSQGSADKFGQEFKISRRHGSYQALLDDGQVQAVYIATPHPLHAQWAIKAAEAGKHLLVEKPIGLNHPQAMAIVDAARRHNVFLMEAFMYRCHPQTTELVELIQEGVIGQVRMIQATFGFNAGTSNPAGRILNNDLGGGGILDVGCYTVSMARLIAGAANSSNGPAEPVEVRGVGHLGTTGVDEYAAAVLQFSAGEGPAHQADTILAQLATGIQIQLENVVRIFGSKGLITVPDPWQPGRTAGLGKIIVQVSGEQPRTIEFQSDISLYGLEADVVGEAIAQGRVEATAPAPGWDDTLGNMRTLDQWRASIGLIYEQEKPENVAPIRGEPLRLPKPGETSMKYGRIPGLDQPVSRLVMGNDSAKNMTHAAVMWDDWIERGGNAFDTAYIYGNGFQDRLLGQWVESRGIRDHVVILGKGAHTPHCNPKDLSSQLLESLDRLRTDHLDIYIMHRDNPQIPVGEFIDVLNEHRDAGRCAVFGGSNWTLERFKEANEYAMKNGKQGMSILNNNFSLARMVAPVWRGCVAASDPESRAWLKDTQVTEMSWSSQARGFFTDRAAPNNKDDAELVRCWYSEDNFQRKARAEELAKKKGVLPINIAAAYVLNQPFPTFALIGPRVLKETTTSLPALDIELTPDELEWLNLE